MLPHGHETELLRIIKVELNQIKSNFALILVGEEVKLFVLIIIQDLSNKLNLKNVIKILLLARVSVNPVAILN